MNIIQKGMALNRLKIVLVEQGKTGKWLSEQLGVTVHTVSRWWQNRSQPSVGQLNEIANILQVDVRTLMISNL